MSLAGIDVSAIGQGANFDWEPYRGKIQFAGIKISEDVNFADIDAHRNLKGADTIGAVPMAYHLIHALPSGTEQANWFMSHCKTAGVQRGDLLALDVEQAGLDGQSSGSLWARAVEAATTIRGHFGVWPVVYTDISLAEVAPSAIGACPLWLADPDHHNPTRIGPWGSVPFVQTGQRGVDTDTYAGTLEQLRALAIPLPPTPPSPPPPKVIGTGLLIITPSAGLLTAKKVSTTDGIHWS